jgi:hypothetical protein
MDGEESIRPSSLDAVEPLLECDKPISVPLMGATGVDRAAIGISRGPMLGEPLARCQERLRHSDVRISEELSVEDHALRVGPGLARVEAITADQNADRDFAGGAARPIGRDVR